MSEENKPIENDKETTSNPHIEASSTPKNSEETKDVQPKEEITPAAADTEENTSTEEKTPIAEDDSQDETAVEEETVVSSDDDESSDEDVAEEIDYHALSKEELITALKEVVTTKPIQKCKNEVEEIKTEFNSKFAEELAQKKEEFLAGGGNIIDFQYTSPLKKEFNSLYFDYKEKRNNYYQGLKKDLQANYTKREELIEELKGLLNAEENINTTYKHFKDIQERWHTAGAIPRDKYNTVWNTYHHHVENFYDFLHLNREFRDLDFKHNLEKKLNLIGRAEELTTQEDVGTAFRELQMLHKMWKEEVGPVAKEFRDEVWNKFSAATKIIHDKRHELLKHQDAQFEQNYEQKKDLISKIKEIASSKVTSHKGWQTAIKEVQALRDTYFDGGKVPRNKTKEIWNSFKEATREFNHEKNNFYKNQKKEQFANLEKKKELIAIAEANKDNEDFAATTPVMKKIQSDWKTIGHVPRKDSDKIWKQFKAACNHFFDKVNAERNESNKEELVHLESKQTMLEEMDALKLSGEHKDDLKIITDKIAQWKKIGRVPYNKRNIEQKFNKVLDNLFGQLNLGKKETEMIRFENKLNSLVSQEDLRKLQNEEFFITKKIGEVKQEMNQLENNLGFFKHAKENNPMVIEVHKNIAKHKENLEVWKAKLTKIRQLRKEQ